MAMSPEEQVDLAREALLDITEGGREGRMVSHGELAMAYMRRHPSFVRRLERINAYREFFFRQPSEGPSKPPFKYRHQTSLAIMAMEGEGSVGHVFVDPETGEPLKDPKPPLSSSNKRYFPIVPEAAAAQDTTLELPPVADHDRPISRMPGGMM
jgi:hypothetical protein